MFYGGQVSGEKIFDCVQCGKCCEGQGGIVLSNKDLARLAAYLNLPPNDIIGKYCERSGEKLKIRTGEDGYCVFFSSSSCSVHAGKPDICRAWPFFRGNLLDSISLEMAKEFCPGIKRTVSFEDFAKRGFAYLEQEGILATDASKEANALLISKTDIYD